MSSCRTTNANEAHREKYQRAADALEQNAALAEENARLRALLADALPHVEDRAVVSGRAERVEAAIRDALRDGAADE